MQKFKPCPFCGHEIMLKFSGSPKEKVELSHYFKNIDETCILANIVFDLEDEQMAVMLWNRRNCEIVN